MSSRDVIDCGSNLMTSGYSALESRSGARRNPVAPLVSQASEFQHGLLSAGATFFRWNEEGSYPHGSLEQRKPSVNSFLCSTSFGTLAAIFFGCW